MLSKLIGKVSESLKDPYDELLDLLAQQDYLNVDETGHKDNGQRLLERVRNDLVWDATMESPHTREALNLEERFYRPTENYFLFITEPRVEPTNNAAEQAIRFVAIHRRLTQGTRSETGQGWCERIWTAIATCAQQGRSVFEYLSEAVRAHFCSQPAPSLLYDTL